jgi:hypothetical protein
MVRGLHARAGGFGPEGNVPNRGLDLDSGDACRRTSSRDPPALTNECFAKTAGGTLHAVDRPSVGLGSVDATGYFQSLELQVAQLVSLGPPFSCPTVGPSPRSSARQLSNPRRHGDCSTVSPKVKRGKGYANPFQRGDFQ